MTDAAVDTYDAEFFLDTACPWCWITSRWVTNVQAERDYRVRWRFISLKFLNEDKMSEYSESHRAGHMAALKVLRVCHAVREREGNDALAKLYTSIGTEVHTHGRRAEMLDDLHALVSECLMSADLDPAYADAVDDESCDDALRAETAEALARTGGDVGTPIVTFGPATEQERSFFGPVIPRAPKGEEAVVLWDAVRTLAASGVSELKRTQRGDISFD